MRDDGRNISAVFENALDMVLNMAAFICSYVVLTLIVGETPAVSIYSGKTQVMLFVAIIVSSLFYQFFNVYRPIPYINAFFSLSRLILANTAYFGISAVFTLIITRGPRCIFLLWWTLAAYILSTSILVFKKRIIVFFVRLSRKQRDIIRKAIIIGDNVDTANALVKEVIKDNHNGIMVLGGVGHRMGTDTGCEKLGNYEDLPEILDKYRPDYAIFAVDYYDKKKLIELVNLCDDRCVKVYFLPVIFGFFKSPKQLERVGSIPIINVHSTPLDNRFNAFLKRTVDIFGSLALIIATSPIMLAAAIGVKLSSPGPIFFKQTRVGKMGKKFRMLKFRSMKVNDRSKTAWSTGVDDRKTRFGNFLRKTSLDELPQLFNVLRGDMSLVGPRPEIPHFVDEFKHIIPLYMVKHYVKPGMTGLAQVKGLRGDTSVEDRIHEDIAYIESWSLSLDIKILLATPFKAFNANEKYVAAEELEDSEE